MDKLVLIDGNSIMNRAFYGIMGSKMLTTKDGKYTNAVYGFLAILFNIIDDIKPEYIAVAFDLKGKLKRKELFEGYKANRHGMPDELAEQMPVIKDVLRAMNIDIIEKIRSVDLINSSIQNVSIAATEYIAFDIVNNDITFEKVV